MGSRTGSHQLSNGLYVSGRPEQLKERQQTVALRAVPYTGGDVKNSGELGKMYGIDFSSVDHSSPPVPKLSSRASSSSQHTSGSLRSGPNSGHLAHKSNGSGPFPKKSPSSSFSGPIMTPIQPTGLLTSGPLGSSAGRRSGPLEPSASFSKAVYGSAVTSLSEEAKLRFRVPRLAMWVILLVLLMALVVGAFFMVSVKKAVILMAVGGILAPLFVLLLWNFAYKQPGFMGFLKRYPDSELRGAIDGHYVKVTGVISHSYLCVYLSLIFLHFNGSSSLHRKRILDHHQILETMDIIEIFTRTE